MLELSVSKLFVGTCVHNFLHSQRHTYVVTKNDPQPTPPTAENVKESKLIHFNDIWKRTYSLADQRRMRDLIPVILKNEEDNIIDGNFVSVLFGGTTGLGEAFAIMVRCVTDNFQIKQLLVRIQMLSKSLCGK